MGAERESFQEGLIEFHGGTRAAEGPKGVKPQRSKAYQLVKSLDTVLKGCCQVGLGHWKAPSGEDLDHQIKTGVGCRVLSIAMDEASPSYSAYWFLAFHEQLCIVAVPDPSHRVWNDMRLAIAATGLWSHVLLDALVYRLPHGPWETSSGLEQTKAGLQLFLQGSSTSDPLFQNLLPKLLRDWGWEDRLGEEGLEEKVLEQLVSLACFTAKGPKVKLTRWMSVFDCISWHDPFTHSKLLAYICWGLSAGWAKQSLGSSLTPFAPLAGPTQGKEPQKEQVARGEDAVSHLHKQAKNSMHICAWLLSDDRHQNRNRLLLSLSSPCRHWHGIQVQSNRSPQDAQVACVEAATGGAWFKSLTATAQTLQDMHMLAYCGFTPTKSHATMLGLTLDHPLVLEEDAEAGLAGAYVVNVLRFRLRGMLKWWCTYPGLFAALLSEDKEVVQWALSTMEEDWVASQILQAKAATYPYWKRKMDKSCFKLPLVQVLFKHAASSQFKEVTPGLAQMCKDCFAGIGQTKVIEDHFGVARDMETRAAKHKRAGPTRLWRQLVQSKALHKTHCLPMYKKPEASAHATLPPMVYEPDKHSPKELTIQASKIRGKATWPTFDAQSSQVLGGDLALVRRCSKDNLWHLAPSTWLCGLLEAGTVVRQKGCDWALSMGNVQGVGALLWPLQPVKYCKGLDAFLPSTTATLQHLQWGFVFDVDEWESLPTTWSSPLHQSIHNEGRSAPEQGVAMLVTGPLETLMVVAAKKCFWRLPQV